MESYQYLSYIFLFGRLAVFVIIVALLIVLGVVLIKARKKRRERTRQAIHELFNGKEDEGTVSINIDNSSDNSGDNNNNY